VGGRAGQLLERGGLELADALAAGAELGGQAVVGAPRRREGARGEDQPLSFLKLIEQIAGQLGQVAVWQRRPGQRPEVELADALPAPGDVRRQVLDVGGEGEKVPKGRCSVLGDSPGGYDLQGPGRGGGQSGRGDRPARSGPRTARAGKAGCPGLRVTWLQLGGDLPYRGDEPGPAVPQLE